jgi:aspartyl-tRNA(Asn)/glutamyl-tRNA(Gln) amidotransferase subunit B
MIANPSQLPTKEIATMLQLTAFSSTSSSPSLPSPREFVSSTASSPPSNQVSSENILHSLCLDAVSALPDEVAAVRQGNKNVLNKIVGRVMRESRGRADARSVRILLEELIDGPTGKQQ